jgi:hypothetical protein
MEQEREALSQNQYLQYIEESDHLLYQFDEGEPEPSSKMKSDKIN